MSKAFADLDLEDVLPSHVHVISVYSSP